VIGDGFEGVVTFYVLNRRWEEFKEFEESKEFEEFRSEFDEH
jgi:hypothetical protein